MEGQGVSGECSVTHSTSCSQIREHLGVDLTVLRSLLLSSCGIDRPWRLAGPRLSLLPYQFRRPLPTRMVSPWTPSQASSVSKSQTLVDACRPSWKNGRGCQRSSWSLAKVCLPPKVTLSCLVLIVDPTVNRLNKTPQFKHLKMLSFDLSTATLSYSAGYSCSITYTPSDDSYEVSFASTAESGTQAQENPHEMLQGLFSHKLNELSKRRNSKISLARAFCEVSRPDPYVHSPQMSIIRC